MRTIHETTQITETTTIGEDQYEICAIGKAQYEDANERLFIELDCFVRKVNLRGIDTCLRPDWLPRRDTVTDSVPLSDAGDEFKEIFRGWTGKVRASIPPHSELEATLPGLTSTAGPA
jgi:hypothetical protein